MLPRRPLKLLCYITVGALLTIAIAIIPPLFTFLDPVSALPPPPGTQWPVRVPAKTAPPSNVLAYASTFADLREYYGWYESDIPGETTRTLVVSYRAGWPLRALTCIGADQRNFSTTTAGLRYKGPRHDLALARVSRGLPLPDFIASRTRTLIDTIPIQPLLPGFLINTALYALALYALFTAPAFLRRRSRKRRHACLRCGYDIQALPRCPECGNPATLPLTK